MAEKPNKNADPPEVELVGFLGVGLDGQDEHKRVTSSEHFVLLGGSEATHGEMQETAIYFEESLKERGKGLEDASVAEALDLLRRAMDR